MRSDRYSRILVGTVAMALVACMDDPTEPVGTTFVTLTGQFNAARVTPVPTGGANSTATGSATCTIAAATFTCTVSATGLTAAPTLMHVHAGAVGASGAVRVNICSNVAIVGVPTCPTAATFSNFSSGAQPATGATYAEVAAAMLNYGTYVNIHTAAYTAGEIRGQLVKAPE